MDKEKSKQPPRRFRVRRRFMLFVLLLGVFVWFKRDQIQFRIYNLINPVSGEIIFHADRDGDGIPQLYRLTFNTATNTRQIEQLTDLPQGAMNGVYSPDGTQIAFQSYSPSPAVARREQHLHDESIMIMKADGTDIQELGVGHTPFWASETEIVIQRVAGKYMTEGIFYCPLDAPYVLNLETHTETSLLTTAHATLHADGLWAAGGWAIRGVYCRSQAEMRSWVFQPLAEQPAFLDSMETLLEPGIADTIVLKQAVPSPSGRKLARSIVYPYGPMSSGIELYTDHRWQTLKPLHGAVVSWSPDEQHLVYDALHPVGTWVIAITSIDGTWTYPLLGNDGVSYHAPSWRPLSK